MSEAKNHHIRGNGLYLLFRQTHFRHSFFALFGFLIGLFLVVIVLMTVVNSSAIQDKMEDSADLLASHMHDQVRSAEDICLWLSMMDDVGVLLKSPELPAYPLLSFDSVMTTMSKNYVSTELFVEKAQKIITSEFGLRAYADYPAPAFLDALHSLETKQGTWVKREYSKGIFTEKKDVFSYIHTLPLFDSKVLGIWWSTWTAACSQALSSRFLDMGIPIRSSYTIRSCMTISGRMLARRVSKPPVRAGL